MNSSPSEQKLSHTYALYLYCMVTQMVYLLHVWSLLNQTNPTISSHIKPNPTFQNLPNGNEKDSAL